MRGSILSLVYWCALCVCATGASAAHVAVSMTVDDPVLNLAETTTLHVFAQVTDGVPNNGIFGYALNVLMDVGGVVGVNSATQLGAPDPGFGSPGTLNATGLHNVVGAGSGFFFDQNRGIGTPYELLALQIEGLAVGQTDFAASVAEVAGDYGAPTGFMLQEPGIILTTDFGTALPITVIPEPGSMALLTLAGLAAVRRRPLR
jgi:hypothetical protein